MLLTPAHRIRKGRLTGTCVHESVASHRDGWKSGKRQLVEGEMDSIFSTKEDLKPKWLLDVDLHRTQRKKCQVCHLHVAGFPHGNALETPLHLNEKAFAKVLSRCATDLSSILHMFVVFRLSSPDQVRACRASAEKVLAPSSSSRPFASAGERGDGTRAQCAAVLRHVPWHGHKKLRADPTSNSLPREPSWPRWARALCLHEV